MSRIGRFLIVAALAAAALVPATASAYTLPNLSAVSTPDMQMAVTFGAYPTAATIADAGAFSTTMTQSYGLVGIPNYDPTTQPGSQLICSIDVNPYELMAVYGIYGSQGALEGIYVCADMQQQGSQVIWAP